MNLVLFQLTSCPVCFVPVGETEKGNTSGQKEGRKELMSFNNERDSDRTAEQQKRDLCVVPLPMVAN